MSGQPNTFMLGDLHDNYLNAFLQENGVHLIKIHANKPEKYALAVCDALFKDSELAGPVTRAPREAKAPPDLKRVALLQGTLTCMSILSYYKSFPQCVHVHHIALSS